MQAPSFFEGVPTAAVESALSGFERRRFPAGAVILAEGDYSDEMYVLRTGAADVVLVDRKGGEHVVNTVHAGEAIGEMSLLTQSAVSATVRAVEDVELSVLGGSDLEALLESFPRLQRNLLGALSARLARASRLALHERPGRLVVVEGGEGSEVLAHALAASVAWHTRSRTLHLLFGVTPPGRLATLATLPQEPPFRGERSDGSELLIAQPEGYFGPDRVDQTLAELTHLYDHILLQVPPEWARRFEADRRLRVGFFGSPTGGFVVAPRDGGPDETVPIPELTPAELAGLANGLLPARGPGGAAIGRLARDLVDLRVGVALGAGSIRGYAHVGALRALEREGVAVDCLAGTSIGATVAGAYAYLGDLDRVTEFLDGLGARMFRPRVSRKSLLSTQAMRRYARRLLGDPLLEDSPIPLAVVATDVDTQDEVVLRRGSSLAAVFASAAVPGVFPAVRIGSRTLVDGGIVNPVPVSVAAGLGADVVIGIRLVHPGGIQADEVSEEGDGPVPSAVAAIMRSIELLQTRIGTDSGATQTILIAPEFGALPAAKLRNFRDGRRYIAVGETAVEEALPRLRAALPWLRTADSPGSEPVEPGPNVVSVT